MLKRYRRDQEDKINSLNRCFFDADHGWVPLALERLADVRREFPADGQVEYAEALIRKDHLGQGIQAEEFFLSALAADPSHQFAAFNSAKYARSRDEFLRQYEAARRLAPDDPDLRLFVAMEEDSRSRPYRELLSWAVQQCQEHQIWGDCAAVAELCTHAGEYSLEDELAVRRTRAGALRELDKAAERSRSARGEGFPPEERVALSEAIAELDRALELDPEDHMLWNFRCAWVHLLGREDEAIEAAEKALSLCPSGYLKPLTNKALALASKGRKDEARTLAARALEAAKKMGQAGRADQELAESLLRDLSRMAASDTDLLSALADRITTGASLIAQQEMSQWKGSKDGAELLKALQKRCAAAGRAWSLRYISIVEEMLIYFCPASVWRSVLRLSDINQAAYEHCLYAAMYLAANGEAIISRDACRALGYVILGALQPERIRASYRESVLGPSATSVPGFASLDHRMRGELTRMNPALIALVADQPPLTADEVERARRVTLARFEEGEVAAVEAAKSARPWWKTLFGR